MATVDLRGLTIPIRIPLTNRISAVDSFRHGFWNEHRVVIGAQRSAGITAWKKLTKREVDLLRRSFYAIYPPETRYGIGSHRLADIVEAWCGECAKETGSSMSDAFSFNIYTRSLDSLVRLGLFKLVDERHYELTQFGYDFVQACESSESLRQASEKKNRIPREHPSGTTGPI
jgi:hypothetical protein